MFRLSREVRFTVGPPVDGKPTNSYGGFPTLRGLTPWFALRVTLSGDIDRRTSYLRNIQDIDAVVRQIAIPIITDATSMLRTNSAMETLFTALRSAWPGTTLDRLELALSPLTSIHLFAVEFPMIRLSQKFEFSASHRLHEAALSDEENRACFGKCNNAAGHGHNYEVQVTVRRMDGDLSRLVDLERAVKPVIDRFDHRHLNLEIAEFRSLNPTVENIAKIIFGLLKPQVTELASITVWKRQKRGANTANNRGQMT